MFEENDRSLNPPFSDQKNAIHDLTSHKDHVLITPNDNGPWKVRKEEFTITGFANPDNSKASWPRNLPLRQIEQ